MNVEAYSLKEYTIHLSTSQQSCPLSNIEYADEKEKAMDATGYLNNFFLFEFHILNLDHSKWNSMIEKLLN